MIKEYFNEKAEVWDQKFAEKDDNKLRQIAGRMGILPGSTVLDIGTGTGVFLPFIRERIVDGAVYALDVAEKMLSKSKNKAHGNHVFYVQADILNAPFVSDVFDIIVCYSAFPHFRDKDEALHEIYRMLREGGNLYIAHSSGISAINEIHRNIQGMKDHILPDAREMMEMLTRCSFINIEVEDKPDSFFAKAVKKRPIQNTIDERHC